MPLHDEETSAGPVRYFNGEVQLACDDLSASGFGAEWGHTRIYSNRLSSDHDFGNGYNWLVRQWPYLVTQGNAVIVMRGTRSTLWFDLVNGAYVARYGAKHTLAHGSGVFTLNAPNGVVTTFNDFNQTTKPQGSFQSQTTSGGQVMQVTQYQGTQIGEIQRSATSGGSNTLESILYTYAGGDIQTALLRRQVNGGAWTSVSQATYTYYGGGGNGSPGDLESVVTQLWNNGAWQTTGNSYYRYWTANGGGGLLHGLKYVVNPGSYDRMTAAGITPSGASDAQLAQYADYYFEYDPQRHVSKEAVQGGAMTYNFTLTQNSNPGYVDDYNNWKMKTVETLPDGSTNTVYTNYVGEVLLKQLSGTGGPWTTYTKFNNNADPLLYANPSAVSGFNDAQNNLGVTLNASSGLVHLYDYYMPTSVGGYLQDR